MRIPYKKENARTLWDDSEIGFFVRGKYIKKILDVSCSKNAAKCLELCCGTGALGLEAARKGADVTGIDISSETVLIGKQYQKRISKSLISGKINLLVGDLNTIEFQPKKYDSVFVWDGLHHISNIDHLVSEISKTLKDDGVFLVHDHVSPSKLIDRFANLTSDLLLLVLPTRDSFAKKILNKISNKLRKTKRQPNKTQRNKEELSSPFEDVSGENIIKIICEQFRVAELERYSCLSHRINGRIKPDYRGKFGLIRFICALDKLLISLRILRPEYFFLISYKK